MQAYRNAAILWLISDLCLLAASGLVYLSNVSVQPISGALFGTAVSFALIAAGVRYDSVSSAVEGYRTRKAVV